MIATETGSVETGYTPRNFTEEAYQIARDSVIEMVKEAEKFGVTVAIEAGINHPLYSYQLAKRLIHDVASPNLKLILDCCKFDLSSKSRRTKSNHSKCLRRTWSSFSSVASLRTTSSKTKPSRWFQ